MKWIVPSVAIAIAVLMAFQVIWISREAEMKHHDERRRIMDAVVASARNLERLDAVEFVHETFDSVMSDLPGIQNDSVTVQVNNDGAQRIIVINGDTEISNVAIPPHPPLPPNAPQIVIEHNQISDTNVKWETSGQRTVIMRRSDRVKSAMQDMIMSYVFNTDTIATRFTKEKTDSIVSENLRMRGIEYAFEASLTQPPMRPPLPMDSLRPRDSIWVFRAPLFESEPMPFRSQLRVEIHPDNGSVWFALLPQILFSLFITGGILLLFMLIYKEALRQKKIGDIRRDFINNMTHEFKTPLATMSLAADTIMNEKVIADKEKVTYYAQQIKNENRKLNEQVEKVLDLALTEKNALEMNLANTDIIRCIENAVAALKLQVESAGGNISFTPEGAFSPIAVDRFHIERLLMNLLDNAIKYGGKPPLIKVTAHQYRGGTEIKVTDNGKGIPKEEWKSIFEPFRRLQSGDVHDVKGFGIGLSYAKTVAEKHNGSLFVSESNNHGTTFTLILKHG